MTEAAGQGVGFVTEARATADILREMAQEARSAFEERLA